MPTATIVPPANAATYAALFTIETVLREFIIETLQSVAGPRWYNQRLPGDILDKYKRSITEARRVRWIHLVPHHPVYYLDFPDLRKIIDRNDNWNDGFRRIVLKKDLFLALLEELEPIRNTVAHNRTTSASALRLAEDSVGKLRLFIGDAQFDQLASRCTSREDIPTRLRQLISEGKRNLTLCRHYDRIGELAIWNAVTAEWWFEESYLGFDLQPITRYFSLLGDYSRLPHARGTGPAIESWMKTHDLSPAFDSAQSLLKEYL